MDKLLSNEKYTGNVILQKTFVADFFSGRQVKNIGQRERVLVENHHEAIISQKMFENVQR